MERRRRLRFGRSHLSNIPIRDSDGEGGHDAEDSFLELAPDNHELTYRRERLVIELDKIAAESGS